MLDAARECPIDGGSEEFLNRDLLVSQWPVLRSLVSRPLRDAWEAAFPQLPAGRAAFAA
ncbi:hypothetical protein [Streptomyces sp. NPDC056632]|uniref:hypothetical protein n=1 Tax=Streptomyces sp. NPDC056632 TaxID=3345884 RepID=UPI0036B9D669